MKTLSFRSFPRQLVLLALRILIPVLGSGLLQGQSLVTSQLTFGGLELVPASGTLTWSAPWTGEVFAQASDSTGASSANFDSGAALLTADVISTYASAQAASDPGVQSGSASGQVSLPAGMKFAGFAQGRSTLLNTFTLGGGTGPVEVAYSVNLFGLLSLATGASQEAFTEINFSLLVDGDPWIFHHASHQASPSTTIDDPFSFTFVGARTLDFGREYAVLAEAETDPRAVSVPEPRSSVASSLALAALAAGALARRHSRR